MNTNAISNFPQMDLSTMESVQASTGLDFAQILAGIQSTGGNSSESSLNSSFANSSNSDFTDSLLTADLLNSGLFSTDLLSSGLFTSDLLQSGLLGEDLLGTETLNLAEMELSILNGLAGQILGQLSLPQSEETQEELLSLLANFQSELQTISQEQGQMLLGQELLMLLAQMSGQTLSPLVQTDGSMAWSLQNSEQLLSVVASASPQDVLQWLQGQQAFPAQSTDAQMASAQNANAEIMAAFSVPSDTSASTPQAANTQTAATTQDSFVQANTTQQNVQQSLPAQQATTTQVPATQEQATTQTTNSSENLVTASQNTSSEDLPNGLQSALPLMQQGVVTTGTVTNASQTPAFLTQMQSGIESGLQSGLETFEVKLVPEGLGEVLVQLRSTENGMTLTLFAQNAETQRMLAAELEQLREGLRPLKVEVQEVLGGQEAELLNQQQDSQQQRNLYWRAKAEQNLTRRIVRGDPQAMEEEVQGTVSNAPESVLDTYI